MGGEGGAGAEGNFSFPTGSSIAIARMLDLCDHKGIKPVVQMFPMSQVNEALGQLRERKGR